MKKTSTKILKLLIIIDLFFTLFVCSCKEKTDFNQIKKTKIEELEKDIAKLTEKPKKEISKIKTKKHNIPTYRIKVLKTIPHDSKAYTQGLFYFDGYIYESTGINGSSSLRKVNPKTGEVEKKVDLPAALFAEGITLHNNKIYQLTWYNQTCIMYDLKTFKKITTYSYEGEGWGLTTINNKLAMSNGTDRIILLDPKSFNPVGQIYVKENNIPVNQLNELEYINGEIWANIYFSRKIVIFSPKDGSVSAYVDLSPLYNYINNPQSVDVLNGIAYDKKNKRIYVTGKYWKFIFLIDIIK